MKILLIADTHYGVRGDNPYFYDYQKKFFHDVVFRYIRTFNIKRVVHLGDLVDNRKTINYKTLNRMKEDFLDPILTMMNGEIDWIPGNHDSFYRNNIKINAMEEFITSGNVYNDVKNIVIDNCPICIVPWIGADNYDESTRYIAESSGRYCFGHLELMGFPNNNGLLSHGGEDRKLFGQFEKVLSGHFHKRSSEDNISYVGSCFEFTWSDYGDYRGMCVLDTDNGSVRYFRNPYNIFSVVQLEDIDTVDLATIKGTYCRLVVRYETPELKVRDSIKKIEDAGVIHLTVDDQSAILSVSPEKPQVGESLHNLISRHIDSLQLDNHLQVKAKFDDLYQRALK